MSITMGVLTNAPLPDAAEVQRVLVELGFALTLQAGDDLYAGGFCPMTIEGGEGSTESGVEIYKGAAAPFARERKLKEAAKFGRVVTCRWGGSLEQAYCGMAICAAIAKHTGGAIFSDLTGEFMSVEACVSEANALLEAARKQSPPNVRKEWPEKFVALLQEQHPDYRLNPAVRWADTEVIREVCGVFHSHTSWFGSGEMSHRFAVTACLSPTGLAPFHVGGRLDVSSPYDLPTSHRFRKGYEDVVRLFARRCDETRAAKHFALLKAAAPLLIRCLDFVTQNPDVLNDEALARRYYGKMGGLYPMAEVVAQPPREWRAFSAKELPQAIVVSTREGFAKCKDEWAAISARLQGLL